MGNDYLKCKAPDSDQSADKCWKAKQELDCVQLLFDDCDSKSKWYREHQAFIDIHMRTAEFKLRGEKKIFCDDELEQLEPSSSTTPCPTVSPAEKIAACTKVVRAEEINEFLSTKVQKNGKVCRVVQNNVIPCLKNLRCSEGSEEDWKKKSIKEKQAIRAIRLNVEEAIFFAEEL